MSSLMAELQHEIDCSPHEMTPGHTPGHTQGQSQARDEVLRSIMQDPKMSAGDMAEEQDRPDSAVALKEVKPLGPLGMSNSPNTVALPACRGELEQWEWPDDVF